MPDDFTLYVQWIYEVCPRILLNAVAKHIEEKEVRAMQLCYPNARGKGQSETNSPAYLGLSERGQTALF